MSVLTEQLQSAINFVEKYASAAFSSLKKAEIHTQEIPRFYFQADLEDPLLQLIRKLAIEKRVERVEALLLTSADLQLIWVSLETNSQVLLPIDGPVISYANFKKSSSELPDKMKWLFKPEVFMRLPKYNGGCISIQMLYSLITRAGTRLDHFYVH